MEPILILAFIVCALITYLPGFLCIEGFLRKPIISITLAPLVSIMLYVLLGAGLKAIEFPVYAPWVFVYALIISAIVFVVKLRKDGFEFRAIKIRSKHAFIPKLPGGTFAAVDSPSGTLLALYVVAAAVLSMVIFAGNLDSASSFAQTSATASDFSLVQGFLKSGSYSILSSSPFLDQSTTVGGYFAAVWHILVAISAFVFSSNIALATNALILVCTILIIPSGIYLLLSVIFQRAHQDTRSRVYRLTLYTGAFIAVSFAGFPWGLLLSDISPANLLSLALIPLVMSTFILLWRLPETQAKLFFGALCIIGILDIMLTQISSVFVLGIWVAFFAINELLIGLDGMLVKPLFKRLLLAIAIAVAFLLLWAGCAYLLASVGAAASASSPNPLPITAAIINAVSLTFAPLEGPQLFMTLVAGIGLGYTFKHKRYLWLGGSFLVGLIIYVVGTTNLGSLSNLFAGFWLVNLYSLGAICTLFAIPLASLGSAWLLQKTMNRFAKTLTNRVAKRSRDRVQETRAQKSRGQVAACVTLGLLFLACTFFPYSITLANTPVRAGIPRVMTALHNAFDNSDPYTPEELIFVQKASTLVDEDYYVANIPYDGSAWVFGTEYLNTLFRQTSNPDNNTLPEDFNRLIRTKLSEIASNRAMLAVARENAVRYVLLLDVPASTKPTIFEEGYDPETWVGIESITETTPGFTLLLSSGDMRLYEIDGVG